MKIFCLALCSVLLLGCSLPSNESAETITPDSELYLTINEAGENPKRDNIVEAQIGAQTFDLEVSDTKESREMGMMYRETMQYNEGMLFVFDVAARYRFWMKNTLIPLDILWLDEGKSVIHFETANPCYKDPCLPVGPTTGAAKYVIELPAGSFVEELGTVVGF